MNHDELIKEAFMIAADLNHCLLVETELRLNSSEIISIAIVIYESRVKEELAQLVGPKKRSEE